MTANSKPVKPAALGVIGKDHIAAMFSQAGGEMETFTYRKALGTDDDGLPFVIEAAFAWAPNLLERRLVCGVNWSGAVGDTPFRDLGDENLGSLLANQWAGCDEPVLVLVHLATPRARYTDRGKSAVVIDDVKGGAIVTAVKAVTKAWAAQRKSEEREGRRRESRRDALRRTRTMSVKDAAWEVLPEAYAHASGGRLPVKARQLYYAARGPILKLTGRDTLDQAYFSQTIVRAYMEAHPAETAKWDVLFDARGTFYEPHTRKVVPLGTLEVRQYLAGVRAHTVPQLDYGYALPTTFPTVGPKHRFGAVLFTEKEGFNELFRAVRLAERYDIAYMSTKGLSVSACRHLADELCGQHGIPLLVTHDFDKAGFSILGTLQRDTAAYQFEHDFDVVDLGLRLEDIEAWGLESEPVSYGVSKTGEPKDPGPNLRRNDASEEEVDFLRGERTWQGYQGRRVELNAFTSPQLIEWLEGKLQQHGIAKVIPDDRELAAAFRRAVQVARINRELPKVVKKAKAEAKNVAVPAGLRQLVKDRLEQSPGQPWDEVVAALGADA